MRSFVRVGYIPILVFTALLTCYLSLQGKDLITSDNKELGSIDGQVITEHQARIESVKELESLELQLLHAKAVHTRAEREILEQAFERIVEEKMIKMEAARRGITQEDLLEKELKQKVPEPSSAEIDAFYEANKQRIDMPKDEAASQIRKYLVKRKEKEVKEEFLSGLEKDHKVIRSLGPLRFNVNASGRPSIGPPSAPVVLVSFSDFQCPYCKASSQTLKQVVKQYGNKVRLIFRQFPIASLHPDARRAAEASLCAAAQNRFWEMHDLLFENPKSLKDDDLKNKAKQLGLNVDAFTSCIVAARYSPMVQEDIRAGTSAGTEGTPTLYINGIYLDGGRSFEEIAEIIDAELKMKSVRQ